jgi:hypothetical protein
MKSSLLMSSRFHASTKRADVWSVHSWGDAVGLRRLDDLGAVLVGPGHEEDVVAQEPVPAGQGIRVDRRVRRARRGARR